MTNEYQKELFNEFKQQKRKIDKITDKIKHRKKLYLSVPIENAVFIAIVIIMCVVVAFAFGVERGKRYSVARPQASPRGGVPYAEEKVKDFVDLEPIEVGSAPVSAPPKVESAASVEDIAYTIQLISYRKKDYAESERDKLFKKGMDAFIVSSGSWYQVCAGVYRNIQDAKEAQNRLADTYKGCFIRRR